MGLLIQFNPVALSLIIPALVSGILAIYAFSRRPVMGSRVFAFLMLALCVWSIFYGVELSCLSLDGMMVCTVIEYLGIATVPVQLLILTLLYTGREKWLTRRNVIPLFVIPAITIIMVATNNLHHFYYSSAGVDTSGSFPMLALTRGPWFWVHSAYSYAMLLATTFLLVERLGKRGNLFRHQVITMLIGMSIPWTVNIIYVVFGLAPLGHLDLTPFAFTVTGVVVAWSMFRHGLFDIMPTAYDTILDSIDDVVVVLDEHHRIVEYNKAAGEILELSQAEIGRSADIVWRARPDLIDLSRLGEVDHIEIVISRQDSKYYYEASVDDIVDRHKHALRKVISLHDITGRKKAEKALRLSEEKFRLLVENSQDIIFTMTSDGAVTFLSPAWTTLLGYPVNQAIGQSFVTFIHPDEVAASLAAFQTGVMVGSRQADWDVRLRHMNGSWRWHRINAVPLWDEAGTIIGVEGTSRDITERKQAERELKQSSERYRDLFENSGSAITIVDENGRYLMANKKAADSYGMTPEEFINRSVYDFLPREMADRYMKSNRRLLSTGGQREYEDTLILPTGERSFLFVDTCLKDVYGRYFAIQSSSIDITDRKRIGQALRESEEKYRMLVETASEVILVVQDLKIKFFNHRAVDLTGYSVDELKDMPFANLIYPDDLAMVADGHRRRLQGEPFESVYPFRYVLKDGKIGWAEINTALINWEDRPATLSFLNDVTERKQMEQKLEEMATHDFLTGLPNRLLLLDRFTIAAALAHRSKDRLAVISMDLDRFKSVNDTLGHDAGDQVLQVIGKRLTGIIRASDTLARIGGDEFILVITETGQAEDATAVAQKILDSFKGPLIIGGHHLNLSASIGIAIYPEDGQDLETLTKKSDAAMYYSKDHGRNQFKFFSDGDVLVRGYHKDAE